MTEGPGWLLLIHQLPAKPASLRVKVWRRVLRIGAVGLRGSVYVLPHDEHTLEDFQWLAKEIGAAGGEASVCAATFLHGTTNGDLAGLFRAARDADYAALSEDLRTLARAHKTKTVPPEEIGRVRQRLAEIIAIDFFAAPKRETAEQLLAGLAGPRDRAKARGGGRAGSYRGRTWVTRTGIQVDRMASAWLIRRFIDPIAMFRWVVASSYVHVPNELRFDMAEGEFTHEGEDCTFETLIRRFDLGGHALTAISEIIHDIDLKDDRFARPEAAGLAHVLSGISTASADDDQRLARASAVFDDLHRYFSARPPERASTIEPRHARRKGRQR